MATTEAKSKRDLIWEQKKRAREQRAQGGNQDAPSNPQPIDFAKKPLFADNNVSEPILQPSQPMENQEMNWARNQAYLPSGDNNKPANNSFPERREPPIRAQEPMNQPNYSDYEPQINNRKPPRVVEEPQEVRKAVNFNPTFEPSQDHNHSEPVRDSRDGFGDTRKRKADYGEELRNQMKQKEMQKQQEKNEARTSVQGGNYGDKHQRDSEKMQKNDYADFLRQQMKEKEEMKNRDVGRNRGMQQNPEPQDYNPFGRAGGGAPNRDIYNNNVYNPPPVNNYPDARQYPQRQQQQQQFNSPQGNNFPPFPNPGQGSRELPRQQSYDYRQSNDNYQMQRPPQQPHYHAPPSGQEISYERNPPRQEAVNPRFDRFGSADHLPRGEPEPVSIPSNLNNDANNYKRGNTGERARGRHALGSEDTQEVARKEKMKQDFQKGLQEQVEYKKKMKEMELKKKREEERIEEEKLKREQEELARRMAEENNKNKPKVQNPPQESSNFVVQEPKNRRNREKASSQGFDDRNNTDQNPQSRDQQYGGYPGPAPYNQQQQPPPYQPYQQQPPPYPYNQYNQPPYPQQGYPPQQPYYPPPQMGMYPPVITSELQNIRSEIQNQQQVLSKQLDSIKKEAMTAMEERNKAERELVQLREQLKEKLISEELYKKNLRDALDRNSQPRLQKIPEAPTRNLYKEPPANYDPYPIQQIQEKARRRPPQDAFDSLMGAPNLDNQAYQIRQTNQHLLDNYQQNMQLGDSRTPLIDIDKTLAGDTKLIPLAVFDNRASMEGGGNQRGGNQDPLTLSKIHGYGRPNSSKQWPKEEDSIDVLLKAHGGGLRPGSSESGHGDTSRLIGKRLAETDALLKGGEITGTGRIVDRYNNVRSRESERGDTLNLAARNILGDKNSNIGLNQYGRMESRGYGRGEEAIKLNHTGDILPDLSIAGHGGTNNYELGEGHSMNTTGMSFNVDRINLANEARLKKLENYGGGTGQMRNDMGYGGMKGKGNYYNNNNRGGLEAIEESADMDENLAKIDKILGSYLKTHEEEGINKRDLMM